MENKFPEFKITSGWQTKRIRMKLFNDIDKKDKKKAAKDSWINYAMQRVRTDLTEADSDFLRRACEGQKKRYDAAKRRNTLTGC